jgi:hypothetical protein
MFLLWRIQKHSSFARMTVLSTSAQLLTRQSSVVLKKMENIEGMNVRLHAESKISPTTLLRYRLSSCLDIINWTYTDLMFLGRGSRGSLGRGINLIVSLALLISTTPLLFPFSKISKLSSNVFAWRLPKKLMSQKLRLTIPRLCGFEKPKGRILMILFSGLLQIQRRLVGDTMSVCAACETLEAEL